MPEPLAFLNGEFIPASALSVPVYDAGFVLGTTVAEQLRTFGGRLFQLDAHLERLAGSLEIVEIKLPLPWPAISAAAQKLAAENHKLLEAGDDLGLTIFVTPGAYATVAEGRESGPTLAMHTYRLPFGRWASIYGSGCSLVTTPIEQIPATCWPPELKCRSRMHYYLADLAAQKKLPKARAVLLDREGRVTETPTANVLAFRRGEGLISPRGETILHGISLAFARELASKLGILFRERDLSIGDLASADEVLLTSTSSCVLPVTRIDDAVVGDGRPGDVFRVLLQAWGEAVEVDFLAQAQRFGGRV
jgi:branched-subunit amino acid aminotransferase/4-amino-4-deoxychorismate lyase